MIRNTGRVTVKDVAKLAGVSVATVSRVLNQNYYVSPEIEKRVLKAKEELGYYQNSIARSLKTNSTQTIGFVVADISNTYHITIARAIESVIHAHNYNLIVCSTENQKERELEYLKMLLGRNIDALVLNSTGYNDDFIAEMSKRLPIVLTHRRVDATGFVGDVVDSDNAGGVYDITKQLLTLGHRKIFVIKGTKNLSNNLERVAGFNQAMAEYGIVVDANYPYQYDGMFTLESGYKAAEYICQMPVKPTAVVSLNNMMTIGALKCFKEKNVNIPDDLSISSYNGIDNMELMAIRPTVVNVDPRNIGIKIGNLILERIENNNIKNRTIIVDSEIVVGNAISVPTDNLQRKRFD